MSASLVNEMKRAGNKGPVEVVVERKQILQIKKKRNKKAHPRHSNNSKQNVKRPLFSRSLVVGANL